MQGVIGSVVGIKLCGREGKKAGMGKQDGWQLPSQRRPQPTAQARRPCLHGLHPPASGYRLPLGEALVSQRDQLRATSEWDGNGPLSW